MTPEEFQRIVTQDSVLAPPMKRVAQAVPTRQAFINEIALYYLLFPVAKFVIKEVGLPWLYSAARYSEMWREKFDTWIDTQITKEGINPEQARVAAEAMRKELERTTEEIERESWEQLSYQMGEGPQNQADTAKKNP